MATAFPPAVPLALAVLPLAVAALGAARIGEMADRYLVLPIFATAWLVAAGIDALPAPLRLGGRVAGAAAVAALAVAAATHVRVYANDEALWTDAWQKNPHSLRAAANLGALYLDRDEPYRAAEWLERASALAPGDAEIEMNRALVAERQGDASGARTRLDALVAAQPWYWPASLRAGHLALAARDFAAAADHYEAALRGNPLAAEAWAGLGVARAEQGRDADARRAVERALALDPQVQNAEHCAGCSRGCDRERGERIRGSQPRDRIGIVVLSGLAVALYSYYYDRFQLPPRLPGSFGLIVGGDVLPLFVVPMLVIRFGLHDRAGRYGWRWPGTRAFAIDSLAAYAAVLPFVLWLSQGRSSRPSTRRRRFLPRAMARSVWRSSGSCTTGRSSSRPSSVSADSCCSRCARQLGIARAIAVTTAPYVLLHFDKPPLEVFQAAWAGIAFGVVAWRSRSLLPAFAAHWAIAVTMDWLCYQHLVH